MLGETVVVKVDPRQAESALRVPMRDAHELVVGIYRLGVGSDLHGNVQWNRTQDQLAEHHDVHDPPTALLGLVGHHGGEFLRRELFQRCDVDAHVESSFDHFRQQARLYVGDLALVADGRRDAASNENRLFG